MQSDRHLGEAQPGFGRAKGAARSSAPAQSQPGFRLPACRTGSLHGAELAPSAQSPALAAGFTATECPARNLHSQIAAARKLNSTQPIENNHSGSRQIATTLGALWAQLSRTLSEAPAKRCGHTPFLLATLPRVEFALTHSQHRVLIFLPATRCGFLELAFPPAPYALRIDGAKGTVRAPRHTSRGSRVARHVLYANLLQSEAAGDARAPVANVRERKCAES